MICTYKLNAFKYKLNRQLRAKKLLLRIKVLMVETPIFAPL
jgi:hypothetical protein